MRLSPAGAAALESREGRKLAMYRDRAGLPTIGVGHRLTQSELASGELVVGAVICPWQYGITDEEATTLLEQDCAGVEAAITRAIRVPLTQAQFDTLVSFAFNVGGPALERSTLARLLNQGGYTTVPGQLALWVHDRVNGVEVVDPELVARRAEESAQWVG